MSRIIGRTLVCAALVVAPAMTGCEGDGGGGNAAQRDLPGHYQWSMVQIRTADRPEPVTIRNADLEAIGTDITLELTLNADGTFEGMAIIPDLGALALLMQGLGFDSGAFDLTDLEGTYALSGTWSADAGFLTLEFEDTVEDVDMDGEPFVFPFVMTDAGIKLESTGQLIEALTGEEPDAGTAMDLFMDEV